MNGFLLDDRIIGEVGNNRHKIKGGFLVKYYLGIDGGGTRTTAAVSDENGNIRMTKVSKGSGEIHRA